MLEYDAKHGIKFKILQQWMTQVGNLKLILNVNNRTYAHRIFGKEQILVQLYRFELVCVCVFNMF